MDYCSNSIEVFNDSSPYELLLKAATSIPISHYLWGILLIALVYLYNLLEIHIIGDLCSGFRGESVSLTFQSGSELYQEVASRCRVLHGRYLPTPWLSSPHLQTAFLSYFGRPPVFSYRRQLFHTPDGGTIALDWLMNSDVSEAAFQVNNSITGDGKTPIMVVIPGLTSDSASAYVKHLAFRMANRGWNVVVSNHRGLGGISITSDCFYNAGWTDDIRKVVEHLHGQYPDAPLFIVGTSIGANILVKYLGEDGINIPIVGAAAICSPWDLLLCGRFMKRRPVQRFYDKVLATGLRSYAKLHQHIISRLADWEAIEKSLSLQDFDNHATRVLGKYETVDTFYRRCSSANFVGNVMVPLLCISALDDPVCTEEAIPWDECRANKNIILATTKHGGHLAFYEGIAAESLWWLKAVDEFLTVLLSSSFAQRRKEMKVSLTAPLESSIDQGPFVNVSEDGMLAAVSNEQSINAAEDVANEHTIPGEDENTVLLDTQRSDCTTEKEKTLPVPDATPPLENDVDNLVTPLKRGLNQLSLRGSGSIWLLAYIAMVTTWPLVGPSLLLYFKKKFRGMVPAMLQRR